MATLRPFCAQRPDGTLPGYTIYDSTPNFYWLELVSANHRQTGLVACASLNEYQRGSIKKHEHTLHQYAVQHAAPFFTRADREMVLLAYRAQSAIDAMATTFTQRTPAISGVTPDLQITYRYWPVTAADQQQQLIALFDHVKPLYIADGHHRVAEAWAAYQEHTCETRIVGATDYEPDYFLCLLVPDNQLQVYAYDRVIRDVATESIDSLLTHIAENFSVTLCPTAVRPSQARRFGMYCRGAWYELSLKDLPGPRVPSHTSLDAELLQTICLAPLFGISDPGNDPRLSYVSETAGLAALQACVDQCNGVAFTLYPTSIQSVFYAADHNLVLPPKSTWFEPKIPADLITRPYRST